MAIETAIPRTAPDGSRERPQLPLAASTQGRIEIDGKQFKADGRRFQFRGVSYGTFAERVDGALFPDSEQLVADLEAIATAGFNVVRTYTPPPDDMVEIAGQLGLRILAGVDYRDWRYLLGSRSADIKAIRREARQAVAALARRAA